MKISTLDLTDSRYQNTAFQSALNLSKNTIHVFDSFHNSFFETYWWEHTNLRKVRLHFRVQGKGSVQLIRNTEEKTSIVSKHLIDHDTPHSVTFEFDVTSAPASRLYLQVECAEDCVLENAATFETLDVPQRDVRLALVMCTFNKQDYILKNLKDLMSSSDFLASASEIFVVDNASNLSVPAHEKIHYFAQGNFGGAGGFTRGLIEARKTGRFTHYLFMDDDIELDPDMITRTATLAAFANDGSAICGGMLSIKDKNVLWELGANFYNKKLSGSAELCYHEVKLSPSLLSSLSKPFTFDYGGWWYFCISETAVEKIGYPFPCFIRGDDVEYGVRLNSLGLKNLPFPGIAVWHEPLTGKTAPWLHYFRFRNYMIIGLLYGTMKNAYVQTIKYLLSIAGNILLYDYKLARVQLEALSGVMAGSEDIGKLSNPDYKNLITKKLNVFSYQDEQSSRTVAPEISKGNALTILLKLLSLNGHLVPVSTGETHLSMKSWRRKIFTSTQMPSTIHVINEENGTSVVFRKSFSEFTRLLLNWIATAITILLKLPILIGNYKIQRKQYTQYDQWKKFLALS